MPRLHRRITADTSDHALTHAIDEFGRMRQTEISPVISLMPKPEITNIRSRTQSTGSGSITTDGSEISVSTGATAGSTATLDTQQWGRYIPGYSGVYGIRAQVPKKPQDDAVLRWGAFTDSNGIIWGVDSTGLFVQIRDGGVDSNRIRPSDFQKSLMDWFDVSRSVIYRNPFTFYGAGAVYFEIFGSDRGFTERKVVHGLSPDQKADIGLTAQGSPMFEQPNFPIRAEVDNGTESVDYTVEVIGRQFDIIGKYQPSKKSIVETEDIITVGTTDTALQNWQFKADFRPVEVKFSDIQVINQSPERLLVDVFYNTSVTGANYTEPNGFSPAETPIVVDDDGTATGGEKITEFIVEASGQKSSPSATKNPDIQSIPFPKYGDVSIEGRSLTGQEADISITTRFLAEM